MYDNAFITAWIRLAFTPKVGPKTFEKLIKKFIVLNLNYNKIKGVNAEQRPGTAGGEGGAGYNIYCPEGTVMIGLTGGAGRYVDQVGPICK